MEEKNGSWGTLPNSQHFGSSWGVLELQDGTRTNSQARVQNDINLHNQEKRVVSASQMKVMWRINKDNFKHKIHTAHNLWE